jgi:hypothetical protein
VITDPWGQPNVSRIIIGGTQVELFGEEIGIYGIAESIDVGNFVTNETAVVLLDALSLPAEDDDPEFPFRSIRFLDLRRSRCLS